MANSRSMYMEKCDLDHDGTPPTNVTFSPLFGVNTWQLRIISNNDAAMSLAVETIDEDASSNAIHIDGSPFTNVGQGGHADSDFTTGGHLEITLDSTNPSVKVTISGGNAEATVKCKAYRTLEDVATGGYTDITP